jgi:hypothetical protein
VVEADNVQPDHAEQLIAAAAHRLGRSLALLPAAGRGEVDGLAADQLWPRRGIGRLPRRHGFALNFNVQY